MFTRSRRVFSAVLSLTFFGYLSVGPAPVSGRVPDVQEPSPLFTGTAIPEPPQQRAKWEPPTSKVPKEFVSAAAFLFQQGLADPRGCEYRAIAVATGSCWTGDAGVVRTRGWVLPAKEGDKHRFAVCWNGLVYPLVSVGDKADLQKDVKTAIENRKKERDRDAEVGRPQSEEGWSLWHGNLGTLEAALLLRLGEADLVSELWVAIQADEKGNEFYIGLAANWAWTQFDRALGAHMRGDDVLALHSFRRLSAFTEKLEAEAKNRGLKPDKGERGILDFARQVPDLLADQERRAKSGIREVVCISPGREPDQKKRIAALIDRLNEVNARQWGQPGGVHLGSDPIVRALIREGEPALEPLLRCFEDDRRLTRSVHFWRDFSHSRTCLSVHEAAYVALSTILAQSDFAPAATGDNLTARGDETRKQLADVIRERVKTAKRLPRAERWFAVLADDKVKPEEWAAAARQLASPDDTAFAPGTMVWSGSSVRLRPREEKPKLVGEPLREKKDPSVTELLLKRIGQCDDVHTSADLSLVVAVWEPKAALKPLAEQMKRLREKENWYGYVLLVERRCELGDLKALDDYADFIRTATPETLNKAHEERGYPNLFHPMADYPDHPGVIAAAEKLFGDPKTPWLPLVGDRGTMTNRLHELIPTHFLRLPAFRNAVIKELGNKGGDGTIRIDKYGSRAMSLPGVTNSYGGGWRYRELDIPEAGAGDKFRICDFIAWQISEKFDAAPWCELYWPEEKRDKAVAACAEFLRRYGDHLFRDQKALVSGRPATPKDVRDGKAVFSLAGAAETRVVAGLKLPLDARWLTLKHRPYQETVIDPESGKKTVTTTYRQYGQIVQAEEVKKDGKWQRYYGFVGSNHVARVPAEEIEFPPEGIRSWDRTRAWVPLGSGFHARLDVPPLAVEPFDGLSPRFADAKLVFSVTARNARGSEQTSPVAEKSVRMRLLYSPERVSPQGALTPKAVREADWAEVPQKAGARFTVVKDKVLGPTEETKLATVDLREWFDPNKPGFYRLQLVPLSDRAETAPDAVAEIQFSLAPSRPKPDGK